MSARAPPHSWPLPENLKAVVQVREPRSQKTFRFKMHLLATISEVQSRCAGLSSIPVACQALLYLGRPVSKRRSLLDLVDWAESDEPEPQSAARAPPELDFVLAIRRSQADQFGSLAPLHVLRAKESQRVVSRVLSGMNRRLNPEPTPEGLSGSYFLKDRFHNRAAIFKPKLHEPFAPLNPKGLQAPLGSEVHVSGVQSGTLYLRERAAYLVDEKGLFSVPETFLAAVEHPFFQRSAQNAALVSFSGFPGGAGPGHSKSKCGADPNSNGGPPSLVGSVQKMVANNGSVSNISVSKLPPFEVQKVAVLDMLILNADRNEGNILFRRSRAGLQLIPIDHGLSLGSALRIRESEVVWTRFPQVRAPLAPALAEYLEALNPERLARRLKRRLRLEQRSLDLLRFAGLFLKTCAREGLSVAEMAELYYRKDDERESALERVLGGVEFMSRRARRSEEWYAANQILARRRRLGKKPLETILAKLESSTGAPSEPSEDSFSRGGGVHEAPRRPPSGPSRPVFKEDLDSFIFSSQTGKGKVPFAPAEDFSEAPAQKASFGRALRLSRLESFELSDARLKSVSGAKSAKRIVSEEEGRRSAKALRESEGRAQGKPVPNLAGSPAPGAPAPESAKAVGPEPRAGSLESPPPRKGRPQARGVRSHSAFASRLPLRGKPADSESFASKRALQRRDSFLELPTRAQRRSAEKTERRRSELKFHYFECFLEQFLEARRFGRMIARARRKYTLCVQNQ